MIEQHKRSKYLKKPEKIPKSARGFYHHVFGVDTSSFACVAAYISDCINQHTAILTINEIIET